MSDEVRVPIERIEEDGTITPGTARLQNATLDDYRNERGIRMSMPPGSEIVVLVKVQVPVEED